MDTQQEQPQLVTMRPAAVTKIKELLKEEDNPELKLRMFVSGGGCSGSGRWSGRVLAGVGVVTVIVGCGVVGWQ